MNLLNVGGTMTGGSTVALTPAGITPTGKASYVTPSSTRLNPQLIDFLVKPATTTKTDPGVARAGLKIALANRVESEGCCNVTPGTVIIDLDVRWPLSQPEALVDDALEYLQAAVFSSAFIAAVKNGILPVS